ncbi:MAG: hypothetical protein EBY17_25160 [Acidobacteriia bacterium]|jgi:hypothetical protein|nr:hypothetical protein [Terriglobia bacterium]
MTYRTKEELLAALKAAGIAPSTWKEQPEKKAPFDREIDLLQRFEHVIVAQMEADKAKLTDLQLQLNKLEAMRRGE